ncbi:MAG: tetratricopeptide repeat protein [Anaerolineae bacterium]|nr:tetratricopeptide repeat protein [Anaerolineae bacterium]
MKNSTNLPLLDLQRKPDLGIGTPELAHKEKRRLLLAAKHAKEGAFAVIAYTRPDVPDTVSREIAAALDVPLQWLRLTRNFVTALDYAQQLPAEQRQQTRVVSLSGLDQLVESGSTPKLEIDAFNASLHAQQIAFASQLDIRRDVLTRYTHLILLWVTLPVVPILLQHAPNFMSRVGGGGYFDLTGYTHEAKQDADHEAASIPASREVQAKNADELRQDFALTTDQLQRTLAPAMRDGVIKHLIQIYLDAYDLGVTLPLEPLNTIEAKIAASPKTLTAQMANDLGWLYLERGDARQAKSYFEAALHKSQATQDKQQEGRSLNNLGNAYNNLGEVRTAIGYYEQALGIAREIGDRRREGTVLGNLGVGYKYLGEVRTAIGYYEQNLSIAREIGDRRGEGTVLGNLGVAYKYLGEVRKAIGYYEQGLGIAREIGDRGGEGYHVGNLGNAYRNLGEVSTAIGYYEQALGISREIGDRGGEGAWLGNLGNAYRDLGEVRTAIGYYEQALGIAREIGDRRGEGNRLGNLGIAYRDLGEVRTAIGYYEQALCIAREIGDRSGEGTWLGNLGNAYRDLGEMRTAIGYYEQALGIAREIGDRRGEGLWLGNLGTASYKLEDNAQAKPYLTEAIRLFEKLELPVPDGFRNYLARIPQ